MMRGDWVEGKLEDLLNYIQPANYIVYSTNYDDAYKIPVLTAGKTFVLGYTNETNNIFTDIPVIIFDDFTTATQYVNFKFKVKSSAMKILVPTSNKVNVKYVYYYMQTIRYNVDTHKRYWISIFSKLNIRIAPAPEQRAIVAKIEELFSELDSGIESLNKAKKQLEVYRQSVLKAAFEGKFTNSEKEGWQETNFNKLIKNISTSKKKVKQRDCLLEGKYPVIDQGQELIGGYIDDEEKIVKCNLPVIVFGDHTKVVKYINFEFAPGGDGTKIFEAEKGIHSKYLYYVVLFLSKKIKDKGYARHYQYLKKEDILLAPFVKQEEIVKEIESRLSVCENIEANIDKAFEKAEALRHSILKKAFEGKLLSEEELEVCKQEDDWEPAEKLLKRIKEANKEVK